MNVKKITESLDHLSDRYIEEALDSPVRKSSIPITERPSRISVLPRKLITAVAMVCIGIGIGYAALNTLPDTLPHPEQISQNPTTAPKNKNSIFSPLTITAYAAERPDDSSEEGVTLEENIPTVLSQYSPFMSSVPAMPFSFSYQKESEEDDIHFLVIASEGGILQKYQQSPESWEMTEEANLLSCDPDEKIYWQPLMNSSSNEKNNHDKRIDEGQADNSVKQIDDQPSLSDDEWIDADVLESDSFIIVQVYSDETLLETQYIGISHQDLYYTATLKLSVTTDRQEYDDVIIESKGYDTTDDKIHQNIIEKRTGTSANGQTGSGGQTGSPSNDQDKYQIHAE